MTEKQQFVDENNIYSRKFRNENNYALVDGQFEEMVKIKSERRNNDSEFKRKSKNKYYENEDEIVDANCSFGRIKRKNMRDEKMNEKL